jgi:hypothetical protein
MGKPTALELLEMVHPGVRARLDSYGGTYLPPDRGVELQVGHDANGRIVKATIGIRLVLPDNKVIQILTRNNREREIWRNSGYFSFHCGPSKDDMAEVFFRIDQNKEQPLHCHIRGQGKPGSKSGGHVHPNSVDPDIRGMDPLRFLDLVDAFIRDGTIPLRKVGP